ncbi:MAG: hypothetical protein ABI765_16335 [Gemmatimonadota bacterium]
MQRLLLAAALVCLAACNDPSAEPAGPSSAGPSLQPPPGPVAYLPVDLGSLPGGDWAMAIAVSSDGRVVGEAEGCDGKSCRRQAVYWDNGQPAHAIPSLSGSVESSATGIIDRGDIVGWSRDVSGFEHGWVWTVKMGTIEIHSPIGPHMRVNAAASNGWTTGYLWDPVNLTKHAFRHSIVTGYWEDLHPPGVGDTISTFGNAIDVIGDVAGEYDLGMGQFVFGYLWEGGGPAINLNKMNPDVHSATAVNGTAVGPYLAWTGNVQTWSWTVGGTPGDMGVGVATFPHGFSSMGRLVGHTTSGDQKPFTWYKSGFTTLGVTTGLNNGDALGLNRCGLVVGSALSKANFHSHALKWAPLACD